MNKPALGRGLNSLIPNSQTITEQIIPEAKTQVLEVETEKIVPNPRQPRKEFSKKELEDLIGSIKEHGILQPLVVSRIGNNYELIAGERRLRASKTLGLKKVPVIVRDANEQEKLELALIENIQRHDLNLVEEGLAYKALIEEFNLTHDEVAKRVGKSRPVVSNSLRVLELPDEILDALMSGDISKTHARTLLAEKDPDKQMELFRAMLKGDVTVKELEDKVGYGNSGKRRSASKDPNIMAHEKKLREIFGTKVNISEKNGKGRISIDFYSKEELMDILEQLTGI